jgi:hypothetical protein
MAQQDFLRVFLTGLGLALGTLRALTSPARAVTFFRGVGFSVSPGSFGATLPNLAARSNDLFNAVGQLSLASSDPAIAVAKAQVAAHLASAMDAVSQMITQVQASGAGFPSVAELTTRFTDFLLIDFLKRQHSDVFSIAHVLGIIDDAPELGGAAPPPRIHWERIGRLFKQPAQIFDDVYGWSGGFDSSALLARLRDVLRTLGLAGGFYPPRGSLNPLPGADVVFGPGLELRAPFLQAGLTTETYREFGITFSPIDAAGGKQKGIALLPYIIGASAFDFDVCDRGELRFESTADFRGIGIAVRPPANAEGILNLTGSFHASIRVKEKPQFAQETVLIGTAGGTRLSVQGLGVNWYADGSREKMDLGVEGNIDTVRLVIAGGEGDGFLQKILSGVRAEARASVGLGMSLNSGFTFRGGGKLALDLGVHVDAGPVHFTGLRIALGPDDTGFALESGVMLQFDLGPMKAVAENIGLRSTLRFQSGNLGPLDLNVAFMPPIGVGLSMDVGGFKGGGYLRFDADRREYAGALELDFHGLFTVKAVGLINTKMPDGAPGYSLLILISAEFTPIQLSFGFTLNGVGGLFGLNRTIFVDALAEGIRTNAVKSILFPDDIVANITRIISDIRQFFPPQDQHFVVGPMAKLGWGTPSIITAELGLMLDLPNPMFAIEGVLRAMLPAEDAPILHLQVNFIGVMDFDRGYLFFRADLYDSRLLVYAITGSMAFLVSWGEQKTFALSVGGFHPDFRDIPTIPALPDGFNKLARIGISLLSDDNPRLKIESYFAVTSNTVQFGAKVELYAEAGSFNVYGFLGYDVLFQLDPFRFIADLYGGIALREDMDVIAGINITARLSGPTPWDARGTASLTILFVEIDVDFHVTWGDPPPAIDTQTEDLLKLLQAQLADTRNWRANLPPQNHLHVSLRALDPAKPGDPLIIHPAGVLTFSQRAMPLNGYLIEKFGARKPLSDNQFTLSGASAGGLPLPADYLGVREQFAPAQFSNLSDSDKLSRRSFEALPSGFSLTGTSNLQATLPVSRGVDYELSYLHRKPTRTVFKGIVSMGASMYRRLVRGCAARQSVLANQQIRVSINAPPQVVLPKEEFAVASVVDLTAYATPGETASRFPTEAEAYQYQQSLIRRDPSLAGQVQVVSHYELAG